MTQLRIEVSYSTTMICWPPRPDSNRRSFARQAIAFAAMLRRDGRGERNRTSYILVPNQAPYQIGPHPDGRSVESRTLIVGFGDQCPTIERPICSILYFGNSVFKGQLLIKKRSPVFPVCALSGLIPYTQSAYVPITS
jgi:hypothetical protein